ncbi:ABC transporter ATP-binding protein [Candidatus Tisiphia endosymbiont of Nemotelus uliginosus]|uniref:ABC transporter ATP-binding protein n=1 Tax=Candidatus Tisiphia endosymbiont of Nemotelus uliginosus TaxID=3077926 RepID=UPI0035C89718
MSNPIIYKLLRYLQPYKKDLLIVMLALICVSISLLALGSSFKQLVDNGLKQNYLQSIDQSILFIITLIVIFSISSFFRSYFINQVAEKVVNQIKKEAYSNIINLPISAFEELKIGDIISRLTTDMELLSKLIINFLSFFIRNSLMLIGGIILMFWQSPKLAFIVTLTIPLLLFPLIQFGKYVRNLSKTVLQLQADITSNLEESVTNIAVIQAFNQQPNKILNFNKHISSYLEYAASRFKIRAIFFALTIAGILFSITIVIWIGSRDILQGNLTAGQMVSFIYYAIVAGLSSGGIFDLLSEIHSSIAASERIFALTDHNQYKHHMIPLAITPFIKNRLADPSCDSAITAPLARNSIPLEPLVSTFPNPSSWQIIPVQLSNDSHNNLVSIEFENVSFSYPSRSDSVVFNNLSFRISQNQFIGIVGRTGAGKSTIMQLLLKFYLPTKGTIKIMGQDIAKTSTQQIRQLIGYIPQDSSIFSGTIRSNIAFAKPDATEQEIITAAEISGIMDFTTHLTHGLNTPIGEKGVRLSGGQKQKIAISRAILHNPEILLLDEGMSALDSENEKKLLDKLREFMQGKTILSIAHRISSIEQADEILVIDQGKLVARDIHQGLLKNCDIYQILCQEQTNS